ncbi:hypothetical protein L2E82_02295 [Cichorium intybus]|uniref:Uncharacterized protein n=1 Tax=Cichorium intybus TaxID=13427 RepID=A0ACB9H2D9_CICIN|nr:hypothetical protein L2E82_02295 [Cichorium intybus]
MDCKIKSPALSSPSIEESASPFSFIPQISPPPSDPTTQTVMRRASIHCRRLAFDRLPIPNASGDTDDDAITFFPCSSHAYANHPWYHPFPSHLRRCHRTRYLMLLSSPSLITM